MQTCFFALSGVLPRDEAIARIKDAIAKTYGKRGEEVVRRNFAAVDDTLAHLHEVPVPGTRSPATRARPPVVPADAPDFVEARHGGDDGRQGRPAAGERVPGRRHLADRDDAVGEAARSRRRSRSGTPELCIQCNKCAFVCPHAAIRAKVYPAPAQRRRAGDASVSLPFKGKRVRRRRDYTLQVAPEDCTGCTLCVEVCPAKDKANPRHKAIEHAAAGRGRSARERDNYAFFLELPEADRARVKPDVKGTQFLQPLFEYSGACAGCGETPYLKLLTQLFGDRLLIANATGCSSIYGGNLPTTPYTHDREGRGPAWANSLFEDNAEFGLGMRLAVDAHERAGARAGAAAGRRRSATTLADELLEADQSTEAGIAAQRERVDGAAAGARGPWTIPTRGGWIAGRGLPGREERLDRRRRRLGLRHRLRRPRPRARLRPQRERAGARHRGLLQHRRAAVEGDADRRGGQVRRRRQGDRQEGPRA